MKILFSNPPWFDQRRAGVRAGSRWPHTNSKTCEPDNFKFGGYLAVPFFMCYAASYARKHLGCEVILRDSIAMRESYVAYFRAIQEIAPQWIVIETATPSWEHDLGVIR